MCILWSSYLRPPAGDCVGACAYPPAVVGAVVGSKEGTIRGKLVAVYFYHQQYMDVQLPLSSPYRKGVGQGIKRKRVEKATG